MKGHGYEGLLTADSNLSFSHQHLLTYTDDCKRHIKLSGSRSIRSCVLHSLQKDFYEAIHSFFSGSITQLLSILNNKKDRELFSLFFFQIFGIISQNTKCSMCNKHGQLRIVGEYIK